MEGVGFCYAAQKYTKKNNRVLRFILDMCNSTIGYDN